MTTWTDHLNATALMAARGTNRCRYLRISRPRHATAVSAKRCEPSTPAYWVAIGATAITVLAGARIVEMANAPMVAATRGLVAGTSVVFWAFGGWLIAR